MNSKALAAFAVHETKGMRLVHMYCAVHGDVNVTREVADEAWSHNTYFHCGVCDQRLSGGSMLSGIALCGSYRVHAPTRVT